MDRTLGARLTSGLIVVLTVVGTVIMLTSNAEGILTVYGAENLKFFTVESNLLIGIVHLAFLIHSAVFKGRRSDLWIKRLIYIATVAVSMTFTVVMLFFGPSLGYAEMVRGANLFFHLINPLLAILSLCVFHRNRLIPMGETAATLIPTVLYGLYYTAVLLIFGVHFPETDWYGFASGGVIGSIITAAAVLLVTWVLALILRIAAGGTVRYWGTISGQLKIVIDRLYAPVMKYGSQIHKRFAVIMTARGGMYEMTEEFFSIFTRFLGWENLGNVLGAGKEEQAKALGAGIK